jgi:hypothetical protein
MNDGESLESWRARAETLKAKGYNGNGAGMPIAIAAQMAGWPSPMAGTPAQNGYNEAGNNDSSRRTVDLVGWPTPCQQDGPKGGPSQGDDRLPGAAASSSLVPTEKRGALNPRFSLWLMGFPAEWASCGERAMLSCRKSRRSS